MRNRIIPFTIIFKDDNGNRTIRYNDDNGNVITALVDPVGVCLKYWIGTKLIYQ